MATEKARLEEEECVSEQACQAEVAWVWAAEAAWAQEEERRVCEEEERLAVERDLREEEGPSRERVQRQWLFLPSSDSARSPEEEERVEGPPKDKGKGRALAPEEVQGEVTGVVCDLCDKKGIPCWWGKVSVLPPFVCLTDLALQKTAHVRACLGCQQARAKCQVGGPRTVPWKRTREEESPEEGSSRRTQVRR